jgi:hypothetical protein
MPLSVDDLVPLDPGALITNDDRTLLVEKLNTAIAKKEALVSAARNIDVFFRDRAPPGAIGMLVDYFGDGELKPANQVKRLGGQRPDFVHEKRVECQRQGPHPPDTPPPAAPAGVRAQALAFWTNRVRAQENYTEAVKTLNDKINRLSRHIGTAKDECIDVYGDGLVRRVVDCYWPSPLQTFTGILLP